MIQNSFEDSFFSVLNQKKHAVPFTTVYRRSYKEVYNSLINGECMIAITFDVDGIPFVRQMKSLNYKSYPDS